MFVISNQALALIGEIKWKMFVYITAATVAKVTKENQSKCWFVSFPRNAG